SGVFLDLKYHDIPNTVAGAVLSAAGMPGVQLLNVHALGGKAMMAAAAQAISARVPMGADRPRLLAVTILTSMDHKTMKEVGVGGTPKSRVVKLALLGKEAGADGVVASVQEAKAIRKACGEGFLIITPGVRPKDSEVQQAPDDQSRKASRREIRVSRSPDRHAARPPRRRKTPRHYHRFGLCLPRGEWRALRLCGCAGARALCQQHARGRRGNRRAATGDCRG